MRLFWPCGSLYHCLKAFLLLLQDVAFVFKRQVSLWAAMPGASLLPYCVLNSVSYRSGMRWLPLVRQSQRASCSCCLHQH